MPAKCLWGNCTLYKGSKDAAGVSFYTFSKSRKHVVQQWIINCGLGCEINESSFGSNSVACERHFDPKCFTEGSHKNVSSTWQKLRYTNAVTFTVSPSC